MKKIRYLIEALFLWLLLNFFKLLTPDAASNMGGWIGRTVGPRLAASRKAKANLTKAFPEKTDGQCNDIIKGMWDNLGRVMAEYPHLKAITMRHLEIVGMEHLEKIGKNGRCVLISSHLANWEIPAFFFNARIEWPAAALYREPNNPYTAALLNSCRLMDKDSPLYVPKSSKGARQMVKILQDGGKIGILIDQKYNKGLAVPFFGRPAMTSEAFAQLAEKYDCPILPVVVERIKGCQFRITFEPPLEQASNDVYETVCRANALLERWIRKNPSQWLWLHRRWDSKAVTDSQI